MRLVSTSTARCMHLAQLEIQITLREDCKSGIAFVTGAHLFVVGLDHGLAHAR